MAYLKFWMTAAPPPPLPFILMFGSATQLTKQNGMVFKVKNRAQRAPRPLLVLYMYSG